MLRVIFRCYERVGPEVIASSIALISEESCWGPAEIKNKLYFNEA